MFVGEDVVQNPRETLTTIASVSARHATRASQNMSPPAEVRRWPLMEKDDETPYSLPPPSTARAPSASFHLSRRSPTPTTPLGLLTTLALLFLLALAHTSSAAFINFDNCLDPSIRNAGPQTHLQFVPLFFDARYTKLNSDQYNLNVTIYGNVTGQATEGTLPPPNSPDWEDPSISFGKLVNASTNYTTLSASADVLTFTPWAGAPSQFCSSTVGMQCPLAPAFFKNASNPFDLPAFTVGHNFTSSYAFATFANTVKVVSGDKGAPQLACISASITPDLGTKLSIALRYLPLIILIMVGLATLLAARFSPWSSADPFYWSSNFGRDPDLLRLITPGFGDCLQYIQFVVLTGSLSLNYPGFYQPIVSRASWSTLMFNESFVTGGSGTRSLIDGIYFSNGTYGLTRMSQLVGTTDDSDIFAGAVVWLLVIAAAVILLSQLVFVVRKVQQSMKNERSTDLRHKNLPFTAGMLTRICFNWFNLPIVALSLFQLVIIGTSPTWLIAPVLILLVAMIGSAGWIFWLIFNTKPRIQLFDDLPTLLTYGPLYNTYSDEAAPFAFIPVLLTFIRGAAIGAVQPSGIAQLALLAICEVIMILTLHAFRPFNAPTSMNAYHTFFSSIRLITTLLSIAFVPTLGVSEGTKGWLGYAILLLHGIVLVFGFFLNSLQTLIEVAARSLSGGDRDARGGLSRVFGMRQLAKRGRRKNARSSLNSDAAVLTQEDDKSIRLRDGGRARSLSASSAVLLSRQISLGKDRTSTGMESGDYISYNGTSPGPSTPGGASPFSHLQGGGPAAGAAGRRATLTSKPIEQADPYYRPPRPRRPTLEAVASNDSRMQEAGDIRLQPYKDSPERLNDGDTGEGSSSWQLPFTRASITPAFLRESHYSDNASDGGAPPQQPTDYAVRESDFYYGVKRGPALSSVPARKLRTGPADPVGPVESATGWFRSLLGGKRKEKGKGFEVVRSRPLGVVDEDDLDRSPPLPLEPYQDSPDADSPPGADGLNEPMYRYGEMGPVEIEHERTTLATEPPPLLGPIDTGGSLHLPSRFGSRASHVPTHPESATPAVPRRSSKRTPSMDASIPWPGQKTPSTVYESHSHGPLPAALSLQNSRQSSDDQATMPQRALADEALYLHPGSVNQPASTTRLPFGGADFAADASSAAPTPSPERGGEETRDVGPADPHFRESVTSSMYPASRGSSPIPGGEGAGLDDALSRENTMRENVMIHRDFGSAVRQAGPARSGFGDAEMLHRSIGVGEDNRRVSGFDDPVRSVRRSVGIGMDNRPVGIGMDNGPVAIGMDNRPVSTGRVGRHLASESVRDASQALRGLGGAEAEFVGGIRPPEEEEDVPPRRSRWTLDRPSR